MRTRYAILLLAALSLAGCKKTKFGAGCEKSTALTSPWTELSLPIDEKETRICESSTESAKLRSYAWTEESAAQSAFESALGSAGWAKDRCGDKACYYDKDGYQIAVQPSQFKIKKKKLVTVMLRHRKDPTQKSAKKD